MSSGYVIPVDPSQLSNRRSGEEAYEEELLDEIESVADDEGFSSFLSDMDFDSRIAPLLDRIPQREADLIHLYFIQRKRQADIAEIFEVTQAAISYRLERGIHRIKFLLSIPHVTEEDMRKDLPMAFDSTDVNILVGMWQTTCQSEVAEMLNLTQGKVRHRFFNAVKTLDRLVEDAKYEVLKPYQQIFAAIGHGKNFNVLREVSLPQWQGRGGDRCG